MSDSASTAAETTPLHSSTQRSIGFLRSYVRTTGWVWSAKAVLQVATWIGWAVALPLLFTAPAVVMALCPHPIVMIAASQQLSLTTFLLIGLLRLLIGTPVNYLFGKRNASFITSTKKHDVRYKPLRKPFGQLKKLTKGLEQADHHWLLCASFVSRVVPVMPPGVSVNMLCGAAGIRLRTLLIIDGLAVLTYLYLLMSFGPSVDPMGWADAAL